MTALTATALIEAMRAILATRPPVRGELVAYDGPEPDHDHVSDQESEHRGLAEENRTERQSRWFER